MHVFSSSAGSAGVQMTEHGSVGGILQSELTKDDKGRSASASACAVRKSRTASAMSALSGTSAALASRVVPSSNFSVNRWSALATPAAADGLHLASCRMSSV